MVNSLNNVQLSSGAQQILDKWEADRVANKYNLARTRQGGLEKDILVKSASIDGKNDGKISFKEKVQNFYKGLTAPIYTMLESPSNFLLTLGGIGVCAGLISVTGGAITPFLIGAGLLGGGFAIGKGVVNQANAKTDEQAQKAWQSIGTGTFTLGLSAYGAKTALKGNTNGISQNNTIQNSVNYVKNLYNNVKQGVCNFFSKFTKNSKKVAGASVEAEETVNNSYDAGLKGFWNNLKSKFSSDKTTEDVSIKSQTVEKSAENKSDVIKVAEEDIEVLPQEAQKNSPKPVKDEDNVIDAEFKEIKDDIPKLPEPKQE